MRPPRLMPGVRRLRWMIRPSGASVLDGLAEGVVRLGTDILELEYKDRHEEVVAIKGNVAVWDRAVPY